MQPATALSHTVLGFVVVALLFPFLCALRYRMDRDPTSEPLTLTAASRDAVGWMKSNLPDGLADGGLLFLALLVAFFLVGCATNAHSYAIDAWGLTGIARLLGVSAWEDARDPVRLPGFLKLLARGNAEQVVEAQTFRFLYHAARLTMVYCIAGALGAICLRLRFSRAPSASLFKGLMLIFVTIFVIGYVAKPIARELCDFTLAYSLDTCGERTLAARLFPAIAKLPPPAP